MSDGPDGPAGAAAPGAARRGGSRRSRFGLAVCGVSIAVWLLLMRRFGAGIYGTLGPFALAVALLVAGTLRERLLDWLRPSWRRVGLGVLVGVVMTLATYPLYALATRLHPELRVDVAVLYAAARASDHRHALAWVLAIIVAEELLWRGALPELLAAHVSPRVALSASVATYVIAQAGTGSLIVTLLALVCGSVWTLQRHITGSLLSPLIAHLIWTPTVIVLLPVNAP